MRTSGINLSNLSNKSFNKNPEQRDQRAESLKLPALFLCYFRLFSELGKAATIHSRHIFTMPESLLAGIIVRTCDMPAGLKKRREVAFYISGGEFMDNEQAGKGPKVVSKSFMTAGPTLHYSHKNVQRC